ncbi:TPA: CerR family C-terminal domain-containing protein [Pseudomonas aeruginosa]|nr:CerR family C-terminal domain-containing protein [Pseudomonas aeruginosa]MBV5530485.1 CerR family C-terminal domain-containing protein [Pseudomonas aeruginosa]HBO2879739.1 CerR family C-terminal domain-containing protein [Pseudomonas aeruginosa]HEJ3161521.1 CerR family C-terminal domain-containing protein [Pseudomonas aeruginosa]
MIEAAVNVIGAVGYEGASTRTLTKVANTPLSAIPYHFGGKKELYLAAAQMIADYARQRFDEVTKILDDDSTVGATGATEKALHHLLHIILSDAEPHSWTSFVARCAYENDEAFSLIHTQAIEPMMARLVQAASAIPQSGLDGGAIRLRVNAVVTAIFSFRFLRGVIIRGMDWQGMPEAGATALRQMISDLCRSSFFPVRPLS